MAYVYWDNPVSGDFANASDWVGGTVPGASDDAVFLAASPPYTVTSSADETVRGIGLGAAATLAIDGGVFTAIAGTDQRANAGQITVTNGAHFVVGGILDCVDGGGVSLDGGSMEVAGSATFGGDGLLTLGYDRARPSEVAGAGPATLINEDIIAGGGEIGDSAGFTLINRGVVEANLADQALDIGTGSAAGVSLVNQGLIEAAPEVDFHAYSLTLDHVAISGSGGEIMVGLDARGYILNSSIDGQLLATGANGALTLQGDAARLAGAIDNQGFVTAQSTTVTLTGDLNLVGGGSLGLITRAGQRTEITASTVGATLTNVDNSIFLWGARLGRGRVEVVNDAAGMISGSGFIKSGARTIENAGTIEALLVTEHDNGHVLTIESAIANTGVLAEADGAKLVVNGAVSGSGHVVIDVEGNGGGGIDFGSSFTQDVTFQTHRVRGRDAPPAVLELSRSQSYAGAISGFSRQGQTALDLADIGFASPGEASFSGTSSSGVLTVTDGSHTAHITLIGDYLGQAFVASSDGHGGVLVVELAGRSPRGDRRRAPRLSRPNRQPRASFAGRGLAEGRAWPGPRRGERGRTVDRRAARQSLTVASPYPGPIIVSGRTSASNASAVT